MTLTDTLQRYKYHLLCVIAVMAGVYYPVIQRMVMQWYGDENYSHGFLVPLIAGYFIYERRESLKNTLVSPWNPGLAVIMLGLLQLIAGYLATEYFTMRSSLVLLLAGLVLYLFGKPAFRQTLLPIGYLIMMVPLPYIVYDLAAFPLKLFVTRVSVGFLQLLGIVVLREGNIIMFPSTTLEVADACSGMRSLMSLLALAIAYAFILNIRNWKRLLLIVSAVPVAIITNAARVIVTGILAHFWGAQVAEGFFHEFAGLMVFVLAMLILTGIGALLKEERQPPEDPGIEPDATVPQKQPVKLTSRIVTVLILLVLAGSYKGFHTDLMVPLNRHFSGFPAVVGDWKMVSQDTFSSQILAVLKPTDYLSRTYSGSDGTTVQLYIGYHGGGSDSGEIHSPKNCLPGGGWLQLSSSRKQIDSDKGRVNLVKAVYSRGDRIESFYYWFQVQGRTLSDEYSLKLAEITNSLKA
jgi:exosortase D (VPLPA-CTERM-specific)